MSAAIYPELIDLKYLAPNQPSLCIPRVFNNISESRIRNVFEQLELGQIERIDIIERKNDKGDNFKRVFVHFNKWHWNQSAQVVRTKLISGKDIKIVYDDPWFWKVSANKHNSEKERVKISKPHIKFENDGPEIQRPEIQRPEIQRPAPKNKAKYNNLVPAQMPVKPRLLTKKTAQTVTANIEQGEIVEKL